MGFGFFWYIIAFLSTPHPSINGAVSYRYRYTPTVIAAKVSTQIDHSTDQSIALHTNNSTPSINKAVPSSITSDQIRSQKVLPPFVKRSLILHPVPVLVDAPDLLAVVVRDGVGGRAAGRVDAVFLDPSVEIEFFL